MGALLLCTLGGCKFSEPEPSADIYMASVAPGEPRPGMAAPRGPAPTASDTAPPPATADPPWIRALAKRVHPGGFVAHAPARTIAFRPPRDFVRVDRQTGRAVGLIAGSCRLRQGRVVRACPPGEAKTLEREAAAAAVLHGLGPGGLGLRVGAGLTERMGTVTIPLGGHTVRVTLDAETLRPLTLTVGDPPLPTLTDALGAKRTSPPAPELFAAFDQVADGARELVTQAERHLLCAKHVGPLAGVGGVTQRLRDQAAASNHALDDAGGLICDQTGADQWRICLPLRAGGPGTVREAGYPVARLWHRGPAPPALAREPELRAFATSSKRRVAPDARPRLTLFMEPGEGAPADQVVSLELRLLAPTAIP